MGDLDLIALIIPVLFPVLVGWIVVRTRIFAVADARVLANFFLYIAAPALLISVLAKEDPRELFEPKYIAATALLMLFQYALIFCVHCCGLKRSPQVSACAAFAATKFNAILLGLPILMAALGRKALGPVVVNACIGYFTILPLTLIALQSARSSQEGVGAGVTGAVKLALRSAFTYPLVVATIVGLAISEIGWQLPGWLESSLRGLGAAAAPAALVAVGMTIAGNAFRAHRAEVALMSAFRVIASPAMAIGVALLVGFPPLFAAALAISFALPTAKMAFALTESYDTYSEETADIVLVTTVSMLVVFPAVAWICEQIWPGVIVRY